MIEIFDVEQNTPEWLALRAGMPTASEFKILFAKGRGGGESVTRRKLLHRLAGERITGQPEATYSNAHIERGKEMEDEARQTYAFIKGVEPQRVGFVKNGDIGCSPDAFIGDNGLLEIKTALPSIMIDFIRSPGSLSVEHYWQCQGALLVTERKWCDLVAYWPGLPLVVERIYPEPADIEDLRAAIDLAVRDIGHIVDMVARYGGQDGSGSLRKQLEESLT